MNYRLIHKYSFFFRIDNKMFILPRTMIFFTPMDENILTRHAPDMPAPIMATVVFTEALDVL